LNLFIAVILEGFEVVNVQESRTLNSDIIDKFREEWEKIDHEATGYIKIYSLAGLLAKLGPPLSWSEESNADEDFKRRFIAELNLTIYNNFQDYQYMDVILALCKRLLIQEEVSLNMKQNPNNDPE
jgi:hypothetical protein